MKSFFFKFFLLIVLEVSVHGNTSWRKRVAEEAVYLMVARKQKIEEEEGLGS
jgi:hypothetical protein